MTCWLNKCFSEFVVGDYYRLNKTFRGCSGSRFCLHQSVGSRFPLNTEAGNPSRRWKARISPSGVSSSLSGWGVIPGADRHAAPTWRPIGWCCCRSEWWCLWRTCGRKSPERGEAGMLLWSVLPGQVQWKQEFLNSLSETSARRSGAGFTLKQLSIFFNWKTSCLTTEAVRPVKTSVWKEQEVTPVMPSFCVNLRRGMLRRYRQVPRTEADGAFNYSRASNRPGLLKSGRLHTKPSLFQLHF